MLNASDSTRRLFDRLRPDPDRTASIASVLHRRAISGANALVERVQAATAGLPAPMPRSSDAAARGARGADPRFCAHPLTVTERARSIRRDIGDITHLPRELVADPRIRARLRSRALPVGVAAIVLGAAVISVPTAPGATGTVGDPTGGAGQLRLAIAGTDYLSRGGPTGAGNDLGWDGSVGVPPGVRAPVPDGPNGAGEPGGEVAAITGSPRLPGDELATERSSAPRGAYLADGTLLKPIAVDTSIPDSRGSLKTYKVRPGDTLTGVANRFGLSMMTLWWANNLKAKDALVVGQKLVIPPVDGLVVTVKEGDTLASISSRAGVPKTEIARYNDLEGDRVVIGQTLVVPGARGAPIATPKPTPAPRTANGSRSGGSSGTRQQVTSVRPPTRYNGGAFRWPVAGGYLSQRYHYGHYGIDIAADRGTPVLAAASGVVTFAGWRSNGGGYQVWVSHGSNLYSTYNHMSSVSVHAGQRVSKGQRVGRVGTTGWATGPHLHFEVWRGAIWNGGHRVNPYGYL